MRLLNTATFELHSFNFDELNIRIPYGYAILSHRWRDDELDFKDLTKRRKTSGPGYEKIMKSCRFARSRGFEWVWIDTCCIDKRSSSELSEAINSMFRWYTSARECYALLDDVTLPQSRLDITNVLGRSSWFTRGWTLQELIAPKRVLLLSADWQILGRKSGKALDSDRVSRRRHSDPHHSMRGDWLSDHWEPKTVLDALHKITKVPVEVLLDHRKHLRWQSIAEKMRWMSNRRTTRIEDMAYCMLGLFNISMPPLYGEGLKAFDRLQAMILQSSGDESIFAWDMKNRESWRMLAQWPSEFSQAVSVRPRTKFRRGPHSITNQGLRFEYKRGAGVEELEGRDGRPALYVHLNCVPSDSSRKDLCAMYLAKLTCGHYVRLPISSQEPHGVVSEVSEDDHEVAELIGQGPRKRRYDEMNGSAATGGARSDGVSEVIIIHMGQEHHTACWMAEADS